MLIRLLNERRMNPVDWAVGGLCVVVLYLIWKWQRQQEAEEAQRKALEKEYARKKAEEYTAHVLEWAKQHETNVQALAKFGAKLELLGDVEKIPLYWQGLDLPPQIGDRPGARLVPTLEEEDRAQNVIWVHRLPFQTVHILPAQRPHPSVMNCLVAWARRGSEKECVLFLNAQRQLVRIGRRTHDCCDFHKYCDA
jgi:hypothetical protein